MKVFDWDKAARLIKEAQPTEAGAGLRDDWEYTGGDIWRAGKPVSEADTSTYLGSNWAIPELEMDGVRQDCYVTEADSGWDSDTYWPQSALDIIGA